MAYDWTAEYPTQCDASDPNFPFGKPQNATVPGDGSGFPWTARTAGDIFGFFQRLLDQAGITPNGAPESAASSDYQAALNQIYAAAACNTRLPDVARGPATVRYGILTCGEANPQDPTNWLRVPGAWQANEATAQTSLIFSRRVPKDFTLTGASLVINPPLHAATWPPANAPEMYIRKNNLSSGGATLLISGSDSIATQATYEARHSYLLSPISNNQFADDYDELEVQVHPEYGTDALIGTKIYGLILAGTLDRGRTL